MRVYNVLLLTLVIALSALAATSQAQRPDCSDHINGLSFADPISCTSFYTCLRGRAMRRECSYGLFFDPKTQICNLPGLVDCHNGDRSAAIVAGFDENAYRGPHSSAPKAPCDKAETTTKAPCENVTTTTPCEPTTTPCEPTTTPCETTTTPCATTTISDKTTTTKTTTTKTTTTKTTTTKTTTTKTTTTKTTTTKLPTTVKPDASTTPAPCITTPPPCITTPPPCTTTHPPCTTTVPCPNPATEPTTAPATTAIPTEPPAGPVELKAFAEPLRSLRECQGLEDGTIFTNDRHCRRFYVCRRNRARQTNCPLGQWFDRQLKVCRRRQDVTNCLANRN